MKIPTDLKHKPVIVCENYKNIDGRKAYKTEVKGLSLGLTKDNEHGKCEISTKIWRDTGDKLSSKIEEIPMYRAIDMAILACEANLYFRDAYRMPKLYNEDNPTINRVALQGDAMTVEVCTSNPSIDEDIKRFSQILSEDGELLGERLRVLSRLLKDLGY